MQDFPALFYLDMLHLQIQMHCVRLTSVICVVAEICQSQYSMWGTACEAADLQKYKNKQMKSEMSGLHSLNIATFLFIYLAGRRFYPTWGAIWSNLQAVKGVLQSAIDLDFQHFFINKKKMVIEGELRHK